MMRGILMSVLLAAIPAAAQTDSQWLLDQSTLSYHMSHPMHQVDGVSHAAKGKGTCHAGQCSFLIAAPVKSFDSGDTNRDLHMLESTRGAQFPMVAVRTSFPEAETTSATIDVDLDVEFAGQKAHYSHVQFQRTRRVMRCISPEPSRSRARISKSTGRHFSPCQSRMRFR